MFRQKTSEKQTSTLYSTTSRGYREKGSVQESIVLPLQPARCRYRLKQPPLIKQQNSCKTQRSSSEQKNCMIELVLNDKSFSIDCSGWQSVESQLQKIFSDSSVKQNIRRCITIIILERARRINKNISPYFERTIHSYQQQQFEKIESECSQL